LTGGSQAAALRFQEIYGHKKPIAILKSAMAKNRVAHAYLFYGAEGIGKRTVASVFARALNCTGEDPPCDRCPSCMKAEHKNHPNIIGIQAEGQFIKIDAIKEINAKMAFRPENGKRVFILKDADKMNAPAANSLLKTLEEPSQDNVLILTTSRPHALPMTILSRCQSLRFTPLKNEEVSQYLQEKQEIEKTEAETIASASLGSIGRALEMKRGDYIATVERILNRLANDDSNDLTGRISFARYLGKEKDEIIHNLEVMNNAYRDSLAFKETHEERMLIFNGRHDAIAAIADRLSGREILRNIAIIHETMDAVSKNANKTLTLESMLVKLL
jgi:DNA polymerase-3 subunit delta'